MTNHDHMQRARELLAAEWRKDGFDDIAMSIQQPDLVTAKNPAIRAIVAALRSQSAQAACPACKGDGYTGHPMDDGERPVDCPDCAGSGLAEHSITANEAAQAVPEGWQLVPVEATDAMVEASMIRMDITKRIPAGSVFKVLGARAWAAMLAAAPKPEGR